MSRRREARPVALVPTRRRERKNRLLWSVLAIVIIAILVVTLVIPIAAGSGMSGGNVVTHQGR